MLLLKTLTLKLVLSNLYIHWIVVFRIVISVFLFIACVEHLENYGLPVNQKFLTGSRRGCCGGPGQQTPCRPAWSVFPAAVCRRAGWSLHQCSGRETPPCPWYDPRSGSTTGAPADWTGIILRQDHCGIIILTFKPLVCMSNSQSNQMISQLHRQHC